VLPELPARAKALGIVQLSRVTAAIDLEAFSHDAVKFLYGLRVPCLPSPTMPNYRVWGIKERAE
jgi:hypothetical protein